MNPLIYHYEYEWSFTTIVCFQDRFEFVVVVVFFLELLEPENDVIKRKRFMICASYEHSFHTIYIG